MTHNIYNLTLTQRETFLLSFGLEFNLPVYKLNFYKHYLAHERLASYLKEEVISPLADLTSVLNVVKQHAETSFESLY